MHFIKTENSTCELCILRVFSPISTLQWEVLSYLPFTAREYVEDNVKSLTNHSSTGHGNNGILSQLLLKDRISEEELVRIVTDLFLAAADTVSSFETTCSAPCLGAPWRSPICRSAGKAGFPVLWRYAPAFRDAKLKC